MARKEVKITGSIVDNKGNLIGLMLKGRECDFGGLTTSEMVKPMTIAAIVSSKFSNSQIKVLQGKIVEHGKFKINSVPMYMLNGNEYSQIPSNEVFIKKRYIKDNQNYGFEVQLPDGSTTNFLYANVIQLCKWFKPGNFAIRTSSKGNSYICGKPDGPKMEDFPAEIIGDAPQAKRLKSSATKKQTRINGALETGIDIISLYDFIAECNGLVIKLPTEDYKATTKDGHTSVEGFTPLGIGEVASPLPKFNPTKMNVNATFKKVGIVPVYINGNSTNIVSYVTRSKKIFNNGDNYIKRLGIAVSTDREQELLDKIGKSLALTKITDRHIIEPMSQVIDAKSLVFYEVDTSKIDLISSRRRAYSILTPDKVLELVEKQAQLRLAAKAFGPQGGIMKDAKAELSDADVASASGRSIWGMFGMMNSEALAAVKEAGIDIYTGECKAETSVVKNESKGASEAGTGSEAKPLEVSIEYATDKYTSAKMTKTTGSVVRQMAKAGDDSLVSADILKVIAQVDNIANASERYARASELYNKFNSEVEKINKRLWLHNTSMYIKGNRAGIFTSNAGDWEDCTSGRVKKGKVYRYRDTALTVKVVGVDIHK